MSLRRRPMKPIQPAPQNRDSVVDFPRIRKPYTKSVANPSHFKPGVSGNPQGRPKVPVEFMQLMKDYSVRAAEIIMDLSENAADDRVRLQASSYIVDRAWGKAVQETHLAGPGGTPLQPPPLIVNWVSSTDQPKTIDAVIEDDDKKED